MSRRWVALAAVGLLGVPAACSDDGPKEGEAHLEVDGRATVERAGGDRETIDGGTNVGPGDRVSMLEGVAVMRLAGGTQLELRQGLGSAAHTAVVMGTRPVLEAGDLLVTTSDSFGLEADGTDVDVTEGAARVTRSLGMGVAAYDADVALDSAGVPAEVPALRQMVVPDLGRPPRAPRPFEYNDLDTWDRRYLGAAMDLGERLEDLGAGLTRTLPDGEGRTPGFFRIVLPALEDESAFTADLLDLDREPGDTLIGAAITELGDEGSFKARWTEVFSFRDDGAAWGLVALDQSVRSEPLVGTVEEALNSFGEAAEFVQPPSSDPSGGGPTTTTPNGGPSDPGGTDGGPTTTPPPTNAPPPTPPSTPPVTQPPVEPPPPLEPVVDPVSELIDDLLGGLLG